MPAGNVELSIIEPPTTIFISSHCRWWQGVLNGQAGWLSADFVEEIAATPVATAILDEMKPETQHLVEWRESRMLDFT